jgi:hypothetical protein
VFFLLGRVRHEFKLSVLAIAVKRAAIALFEISIIRIANELAINRYRSTLD